MLETYTRPYIQKYIDTLATTLLPKTCTPLIITGFATISGISAALFLATGHTYSALTLLWLSGLADCLDGTVARLRQQQSSWGAYNDLISDRLVESCLILGFYFWQPVNTLIYLLFIIALLIHFSTFLTASTIFANTGPKTIHYHTSLIERAEAFLFFSAAILVPSYTGLILLLLTLLIALSAFNRYRTIAQQSKTTE